MVQPGLRLFQSEEIPKRRGMLQECEDYGAKAEVGGPGAQGRDGGALDCDQESSREESLETR